MASLQSRTDRENHVSDMQRLKEGSNVQVPAQKRAVLGTLDANVRIQPNRNAKQVRRHPRRFHTWVATWC